MNCIARNIVAIRLEGSEKQVQWATTLRAQKIKFFEELGNKQVLREIQPLLVEAEVRVMNAFHAEGLGWIATATVIEACRHKEARFWIDKRSEDPIKWLRPAYGEVLLHYTRNPFPDVIP